MPKSSVVSPGLWGVAGNERFQINEHLGHGGMGDVYAAYDRERHEHVAIKALRRIDPTSLLRFKREFRVLADVSHPNLVTLHELLSVKDQMFFTMELVRGQDFATFVRGGDATAPTAPTVTPGGSPERGTEDTLASLSSQSGVWDTDLPEKSPGVAPDLPPPVDFARVRAALPQLIAGVARLHRSDIAHLDLKPGNVLITAEQRVVVLDFGLARLTTPQARAAQLGPAGTPAYMAPERWLSDGGARDVSDWYSLGVMLYEAFTGTKPYQTTAQLIEAIDGRYQPPAPSTFRPVPADLEALCMDGLALDPAARPSADEMLRRLAASPAAPNPKRRALNVGYGDGRLRLGRQRQQAELRDAHAASREGKLMAALVGGRPGIGKTVLVEHFLAELCAYEQVTVLRGRCYERESVSCKAVDSLVDELCDALMQRPDAEIHALLGDDVVALLSVFPVLRRLPEMTERYEAALPAPVDPLELRRSAFAALLDVLRRLADQESVVLFLDDLQWSDQDSAPFITALVEPSAPSLLFLGTYRKYHEPKNPALERLLAKPGVRRIAVGRLPLTEARSLAHALLFTAGADTAAAERIARESRGNPYFIHELVRFVTEAGETGAPTDVSGFALEQAILGRLARLSPGARAVLELVSIAGRPVSEAALRRAADIGPGYPAVAAELRGAFLIRSSGVGADARFEAYHDVVRETTAASLSEATARARHAALARALETIEPDELDAIAVHFADAGVRDQAAGYAVEAGRQAMAALAFDQAAKLFALALEQEDEATSTADVWRSLADALTHAGRGTDAATAYLRASEFETGGASLKLRTRAAAEFLRSGHIESGVDQIQTVLRAASLRMPATPRRALVDTALQRARLRLRGLRCTPRHADQVDDADRDRIDLLWSAAEGLCMVDFIAGAGFQTRGLLRALDTGDRYRVARALGLEAAYTANVGERGRRRCESILERAVELAAPLEDPYLDAWLQLCAGAAAVELSDLDAGKAACRTAGNLFRTQCTGVSWETTNADVWLFSAQLALGELDDVQRWLPIRTREARERDDQFAFVNLVIGAEPLLACAADAPEPCMERIGEAMAMWPQTDFHSQHYFQLMGETRLRLYSGEYDTALTNMERAWRDLEKSLHLRVQLVRIVTYELRSACAVGLALTRPDGDERRQLLRSADRDAKRLVAGECPAHSAGIGYLRRAGVAAARGDQTAALAYLTRAEASCEEASLGLHLAACRHRRGEVIGGDEGHALRDRADRWLNDRGVRDPDKVMRMVAPGFPP